MAFKLDNTASYFYPVEVQIATDGGKFQKSTFDVQFRRVNRTELESMVKALQDGEITDRAIAVDVMTGWKGVTDADGEPIAFGETSRDAVLDVVAVQPAIVKAWFESVSGKNAKN